MRHVILGAGGVGGLMAGALARAGHPVLLLVRPGALERTPQTLEVSSASLGHFTVAVRAAVKLQEPADVLWICVKAGQLEAALKQVEPKGPKGPMVIPLMNGVEHVARLRDVYGPRVIPGVIRVEAHRSAPGKVESPSPGALIELAPPAGLGARAEVIALELEMAGFAAEVRESEAVMLWSKLCFLAPLALCTAAAGAPVGSVRAETAWRERLEASARECCEVACASGVELDPRGILALVDRLPADTRTSMQRDVEAGREPELDAIGGALLRRASAVGLKAPAVEALAAMVAARLPKASS